jgi:carbon monoxide dehydrogenase subunit G
MQFVNEITLDAPPDELFEILSDVERVAPCLPGAQVTGRDGDVYRGSMRMKVGPVTAEYDGTLEFVELDSTQRRAVLQAKASEKGGQGGAEARIVATVSEEPAGSRVTMETELEVRGRVAQFGRGPMEKISKRMFADFARNLEQTLPGGTAAQAEAETEPPAGGSPPPSAGSPPPSAGVPPSSGGGAATPTAEAPPLNVVGLVGGATAESVGRWIVPGTIGLALGFVLGRVI